MKGWWSDWTALQELEQALEKLAEGWSWVCTAVKRWSWLVGEK